MEPGIVKALFDPQHFAYETGVRLRGISYAQKQEGWQVIFRGTTWAGKSVYCMYLAVDLEEALCGLYGLVTGKGGSRYWYTDRYAK